MCLGSHVGLGAPFVDVHSAHLVTSLSLSKYTDGLYSDFLALHFMLHCQGDPGAVASGRIFEESEE